MAGDQDWGRGKRMRVGIGGAGPARGDCVPRFSVLGLYMRDLHGEMSQGELAEQGWSTCEGSRLEITVMMTL